MDKMRLAVVGCGTISQAVVPGYLADDRCEVVALCDPVRQRAEQRAKLWGIAPRIYTREEDVLGDPEVDAVELLTPTPLHARQIVAILDAGKHVSCQKPVCNTLAETDDVAAAVARAKTKFRISENFLFYPPIVKAKELLDSGVIGEPSLGRVRTFRANRTLGQGLTKESDAAIWRQDSDANAGGFLFDAIWHHFAAVMWWLGDVEKVSAMILRNDFYTEMPNVVTWKLKNRDCLAVFESAFGSEIPIRSKYYPMDDFFELYGPKGSIWVTRCAGEMLDMPPVIVHKGTETVGINVPMDWIEGFNGAARNFIDSVLDDERLQMDVGFSRKVLEVILAAYQAAETGTAVDPAKVG